MFYLGINAPLFGLQKYNSQCSIHNYFLYEVSLQKVADVF
jgi:hypothetical protein